MKSTTYHPGLTTPIKSGLIPTVTHIKFCAPHFFWFIKKIGTGSTLYDWYYSPRFYLLSQLMIAVIGWALFLHQALALGSVLGTGSAPGSSTWFWKRILIIAAKILPRQQIRTRAFLTIRNREFLVLIRNSFKCSQEKKRAFFFLRTFKRILIRTRNSLFLKLKALDYFISGYI